MDYTNRFLSLVMGCLLASGAGNAATRDIPQLNIHLNGNGDLVYEVEYAGKETVRESPLGMVVDHRAWGEDVASLTADTLDSRHIVYQVMQPDRSTF